MKVFSITGWTGSGKTALITRLIKHFKSKNKNVIAVKSAPHKYYLEPESKDTFKFLEAGADEVCLVAKKEILRMKLMSDNSEVIEMVESQYKDCDFLLLEGLHKAGIPMIEVFNTTTDKDLKFPIEKLSAIVSDKNITDQVPVFNFNEFEKLAKFMEAYNE